VLTRLPLLAAILARFLHSEPLLQFRSSKDPEGLLTLALDRNSLYQGIGTPPASLARQGTSLPPSFLPGLYARWG